MTTVHVFIYIANNGVFCVCFATMAVQLIAAEYASRIRRWAHDIQRLLEFGDLLILKEEENELIPTHSPSPFVQYFRIGYYTVRIHATADGLKSILLYKTCDSFQAFSVSSDPDITTYEDVEPCLRNIRRVEVGPDGSIFAKDREGFKIILWANVDRLVPPGADGVMEFSRNGLGHCVAHNGGSLVAVFQNLHWHTYIRRRPIA